MDLSWIESFGRLADVMALDVNQTSAGAMKLLSAMNIDESTSGSLDALFTILAEGTVDQVLNG